MDLKDAVCIVTGSATGVGAACAIGLARKGARVVVNFTRSEQAARDTAEACRSAGGEAVLAQGDVSSDGDCRRIAQVALDRWGKIDGLIRPRLISGGDSIGDEAGRYESCQSKRLR